MNAVISYLPKQKIRKLKWEPESYADGKIEPNSFEAYGLGIKFLVYQMNDGHRKFIKTLKSDSNFLLAIEHQGEYSRGDSLEDFKTIEDAKAKAEDIWINLATKTLKDILGE